MYLLTMKALGASVFPIPVKVRPTFILRCLSGFLCNACYVLSLKYISLSKASVLFWTCPLFVALMASYYLGEKLTVYDWTALLLSFTGIVVIQNPS